MEEQWGVVCIAVRCGVGRSGGGGVAALVFGRSAEVVLALAVGDVPVMSCACVVGVGSQDWVGWEGWSSVGLLAVWYNR